MKTIQIFDPPLCCSTGVCGSEVDQSLVDFAATVDWAKRRGARIERFNLAQQPLAFAENDTVRVFLKEHGDDGLPLVLIESEIVLAGRYPSRAELAGIAGLEAPAPAAVLSPEVSELVALGAAIAAGCEPCFKHHYNEARKLGVARTAMREAARIGEAVCRTGTSHLVELAERLTGDDSERAAADRGCDNGRTTQAGAKCCG
ncbi:arsenical resistance operon trans-acting repressor ArsD [bacterium BMS3Bbin12]|nr:arsenical resistance operon trans-acting repressor ArsD [bacterium BMS3Bbin12]GBE51257.1 arsenical resistance operon trans-acting repressor ArsD [bacterium BMS3Bbin13]HDO33946.1 arsenite efflux transporter metallochaperone ArsD [Chromatiales bacterium]